MKKNSTTPTCRRGFTLVELATAVALIGVLTLVVGTLLVSSHKHWNGLFGRVYRQETTDAFAAQRVFDNICRKASCRKAILESGNTSLELYYWNTGSTSETPDNFARFYLDGSDLTVESGATKYGTWTPDFNKPTKNVSVASNIRQVHFTVQNASVQMMLEYEDETLAPLICASVRQNY